MWEQNISTGLLHNHTEHSLMDSEMSPKELIDRAYELGAKAVALTDHGTMTGIPQFKKAALEKGIMPIVGVEAYVEVGKNRLHLILMAKDHIGEKAINKLVTMSNTNVTKRGKLRFPVATKEMLQECFGNGTIGFGHVIATSACIGGVVLGLHFVNESNKIELQEMEKVMKTDSDTINLINLTQDAIGKTQQEIATLIPIASKKYKNREKFLLKIADETERNAETEKLNAEKKETEEAAKNIKKLRATNTARQKKMTELKKKLSGSQKEMQDKMEYFNKLKESVWNKDVLISHMESEALFYDNLFGHGNFYLEIQNHGIAEELEYMHILADIGEKHDIPYVAANDAHMAERKDAAAREAIRSLRFNKWEPNRPEDTELYIKTDAELYEAISHAIGPQKADIAMKNIGTIVNQCKYETVEEKHYPKFSDNSNELLRQMAYAGIEKKFGTEQWTQVYQDRLEYELGVIIKMGYADYHLIDQDFINITKKMGYMPQERFDYLAAHVKEMSYEEILEYINADQSNIGYVVGPGRGSAAGSLVCYLLGITDIDPIKYDLLFERFLNEERVSMPDIDTDFANGYREVAVEYVAKKYGENAVCRIVTEGTTAARGAIRNMARVLGSIEGRNEETYSYVADKLAKMIPLKPKETISKHIDEMKNSDIYAEFPNEVDEIVEKALSVEGTIIQYGMHAAGVIISDNDDVSDYVPLMMDDKTGNWKAQCDMVESEEAGLLKMDFLGLKNLNIITDTIRMIWKNRGIKINPDKDIIEEKKVIKAICASGKTNSVFQLESGGMKQMLQKFGPDSFEDLILLVAAYRPGPMDYIPKMIEVKHGKRGLTYATSELEPILSKTYGCIIYQEQVQQIFQKLAGYSLAQADIVRRAMSKKKDKVLLAERNSFIHGDKERNIIGCVNNGIAEDVANTLFDEMTEFAKYAFNKSHAAAYARVTYMTAWLKYHYPTEYLAVAMEYASTAKIQGLIEECKSYSITVQPIDINKSEANFLVEGNDIYFGITSIKGIGNIDKSIEARKEKRFVSFADYMLRGHIDKGVTENLIKVGAFDKFCNNRQALLAAANVMQGYIADLKKAQKDLNINQKKLEIVSLQANDDEKRKMLENEKIKIGKNIPTAASVAQKISQIEQKIIEITDSVNTVVIPVELPENLESRLNEEKELLGVYITGHPIDAYEIPKSVVPITELSPDKKKTNVAGIVRNLRIVQRKKDGADMAFFDLEDKTGMIEVVCFAAKFEKCREFIKEDFVICINGNVVETEKEVINYDDDGFEDSTDTEFVLQLYCDSCSCVQKKKRDIIIEIPSIIDWAEHIRDDVRRFENKNGECRLLIHDNLLNEIRSTSIFVNADIAKYYEVI